MSPVQGSAIPIGKYPGAVGRASAADIERSGITYVPSVIQQTVPGAILQDLQGNGFQQDLQYRGFESSPLNGVPQGLAVYQNGVRINEAFGDIVNWDFLPDTAIEGITIVGANPVFGLNALGGAVTVLMRDGFNFQGTEIDVRAGSFGRVQGELASGQRSGTWGAFLSLVPVSFVVFTSTAVGGLGSALGAVLGAAIVEGSTVYLPPSWQLFPSALGVLIVLILFPRGLAGLCYDLRDRLVDALARRHHRATPPSGGPLDLAPAP